MGSPIILSYGMGADSTAILSRWLDEPASRDFALEDLVVVTAQLGSEFAETYRLVEAHVLPRLADVGVRYVQVARGGPLEADGIVVLDDTRRPERLVRAGPYRLVDELASAGTVPQVAAGRRLCTSKHKGWVLDRAIAGIVGDRPFRHAMGFNADELGRVERDRSYSSDVRHSEYPLIEWGWGREKLEAYLEGLVGEPWPKSACGMCPFSACAGSRGAHMARWAGDPDRGVEALLLEHSALAFNPRMALYGKARAIDLAREAGLDEVLERYEAHLEAAEHALYRVRRVFTAGTDAATGRRSAQKKGVGWRCVEVLATGSRSGMADEAERAAEAGASTVEADGAHVRVWLRRAGATYPTVEEMLVVAPAGVAAKRRPGFDDLWERTLAPRLFDPRLFDVA